ncbi:MAG: cation-translocating P-type ATPase [Haloarculaceae archaeon]
MTAASDTARPPDDEALPDRDWHAEPAEAALDALGSGSGGLDAATAERRLAAHGPNELQATERVSALAVFLSQFRNPLVYLLVAAAVLSVGVGVLPGQDPEYVDAALILLILLGNGVFGFVQDYRAARAMEALRELSTPDATVLRDGDPRLVDATEVVPGDVVVVEEGDAVPADARLLAATDLATDEAALTGESEPVAKTVAPVDADAPPADRTNLLFMNTTVVRGRGRAVVVGTGMETQVGAIASQLELAPERATPFQSEIATLGRRISAGVLGLIVLVAAVQALFTSADPFAVVLVAVTLAVAAVPEGLPAVVTLTLALGARRLLDQNALVRNLPVVESLGSVDTIVTDKTGTLTESRMVVRRLAAGGTTYDVDGAAAGADEPFAPDPAAHGDVAAVLRCGAVCNNATRTDDGYRGDPTEVALLAAADRADVDGDATRLREVAFSSDRRRMTVVVEEPDGPTAYVKGAPQELLDRCDRLLVDGEPVALTGERRAAVEETVDAFAGDAMRVLGFARATGVAPEANPKTLEDGLVFLGLQGLIDPPRPEVRDAIADCRDAGVRVVMATGDNVETARAIGRDLGFDSGRALTGRDLASLSDADLRAAVEETEVFARVSPEHKVRVLRALQSAGHRVAMTGDGVNDAPALRNADVGVAMGQRGTDVARQAADVVLQDDNFVTIRNAIAEGRGIFDNIRKFVNYLLSANTGEVFVVFLGVLVGAALFPRTFAGDERALVLTPVMLLWVNLVTDGLPALALGADPQAADVMDRPPRDSDEPVLDRDSLLSIGGIGAIMTVTGLALFFYALTRTGDIVRAQTLLFTFLVAIELVRIQVIRSRYGLSVRSNRWLVGALASSFVLQLLVLYTPLATLFGVVPVGVTGWTWIAVATVAFLALNLGLLRVVGRFHRQS